MSNVGVKIAETIARPFLRLPLGFHYAVGSMIAWVSKNIMHYRSDVVWINISRSFPEKKYKELKTIYNDFYVHFGELFAETFWFGGNYRRRQRLVKSHICEAANMELIAQLYEKAPSVMILNTHFGNWEITGGFFDYNYSGVPLPFTTKDFVVIYKQLKNKFWDKILGDNRCAAVEDFEGYIESKNAMRYVVSHKKEKKLYIFPTDQFPYSKSARADIPSFMNQPTKSMLGAASLAHKLGMAVVYMAADRTERGHYKLTYTKICDDASQMSPEEIMTRYYELLDADVKSNPMNYLWTHKRWK